MAILNPPTVATIVAEGLSKAGYIEPSESLRMRATEQWLEELKVFIADRAKDSGSTALDFLIKNHIIATVMGESRYVLPSDFSSIVDIQELTYTYGVKQAIEIALTKDTFTPYAGEDVYSSSNDACVGKLIVRVAGVPELYGSLYSTTGLVTGYPIQRPPVAYLTTAADYIGSSGIVIVNPPIPDYITQNAYILSTSYFGYWFVIESTKKFDQNIAYNVLGGEVGKPQTWYRDYVQYPTFYDNTSVAVEGSNAEGQGIVLYPTPNNADSVPYLYQVRYIADLTKLDDEDTIMSEFFRRARWVLVQGIFYKALQAKDDSRQEKEFGTFIKLVDDFVNRNSYESGVEDASVRISPSL